MPPAAHETTSTDASPSTAGRALPVADPRPPRGGPVRTSRRGKWRTIVLVAVHVAVALHILHWSLTGSTITPVEPSESMQTLETGRINAGFVFFVLAILATLVLGRWFCGWACHVVAYQDAAAWLCGKVGLRPKPIRSRLMMWAPMAVAFYMFVWPQFLLWFRGADRPPLEAHFTTTRFWDTFAGPGMAILTLLVAGFFVVYWLGSKGFCTYGCPYGAFFGLADRGAVGRIRVTDACQGCRHCTATCTSNVLVHEEVARFGKVVDPGCMKCMDCVDVCPENALFFGFKDKRSNPKKAKRPPIKIDLPVFLAVLAFGTAWLALNDVDQFVPLWFEVLVAAAFGLGAAWTPRRKLAFDFSRGEELAMAAIFLISAQWVFRGLYSMVPLLLAIGLGALTALMAIVAWRCITGRDVTLQHHTLVRDSKLTPVGRWFAASAALWFAFTLHSGWVQFEKYTLKSEKDTIALLDREDAQRAQRLAALARDLDGLEGWMLHGDTELAMIAGEVAFARGDIDRAVTEYRRSIDLEPKNILSREGLANVYTAIKDAPALEAVLREILDRNPDDRVTSYRIVDILAIQQKFDEIEPILRGLIESDPTDARAREMLEILPRGR